MQENDIDYKDKLVAFIDILGFKQLVLNGRTSAIQTIKKLDDVLTHTFDIMKMEEGDWFSSKLFSDCICIACENTPRNLHTMLSEIAYLQLNLISGGIFIRGAITIGLHFENDKMIFSEALIEAYELEQRATYPRIIISEKILDLINNEQPLSYRDALKAFLSISPDGIYFLNYFQHIIDKTNEYGTDQEVFQAYLESQKDSVIEQVAKNKDNPRILEKFRWLAEYHNHVFNSFYQSDDYYEEYYNELISELTIPITIFPKFKNF